MIATCEEILSGNAANSNAGKTELSSPSTNNKYDNKCVKKTYPSQDISDSRLFLLRLVKVGWLIVAFCGTSVQSCVDLPIAHAHSILSPSGLDVS